MHVKDTISKERGREKLAQWVGWVALGAVSLVTLLLPNVHVKHTISKKILAEE